MVHGCASPQEPSKNYADGGSPVLVERRYQTYVDGNGSRRRKMLCIYSDATVNEYTTQNNICPKTL
jgi:hypothetical protein